MTRLTTSQRMAFALIVLAVLAALIVWLAPPELTLGDGIKTVYVHAPLMWTALVGLLVTASLGFAVTASGRPELENWMRTVAWVTMIALAAAALTGMWSSRVTWGGVFWDEPRMRILLQVLAVYTVVLIASRWLPWLRVRGLTLAITVAIAVAALRLAPLVLHPRDPVSSASSASIRLTFVALFALCLSAAALVVWYAKLGRPKATQPLDSVSVPVA